MTSLDVTVLLHFHHVSAVYAIPATAPLGLLAVGCIHQEFIGAQNKKKTDTQTDRQAENIVIHIPRLHASG